MFFVNVDMFYKSAHNRDGGFGCKNWGEMSVKDTLFVRLELVVADNVCIRNGSRSNIGVQAYNTYQYKTRHILIKGLTFNLVL